MKRKRNLPEGAVPLRQIPEFILKELKINVSLNTVYKWILQGILPKPNSGVIKHYLPFELEIIKAKLRG